jgi:hypothetical protein
MTDDINPIPEPVDHLEPEMRAVMDAGIFLAAAAKSLEPYNGLYSITLQAQAQSLFDLVNGKNSTGCGKGGCQNCGSSPESPEVSAEVDSLVNDIKSMMDDPSL